MAPRYIEADLRQVEHEVEKLQADVTALRWGLATVSAVVAAIWFFFVRR